MTYCAPLRSGKTIQHQYTSFNPFPGLSGEEIPFGGDPLIGHIGKGPSPLPYMSQPQVLTHSDEVSGHQEVLHANVHGSRLSLAGDLESSYSRSDGQRSTVTENCSPVFRMGSEDRLYRSNFFKPGVPPGVNPWQFAADGSDRFFLGSGFTPAVASSSGPLNPCFQTTSHCFSLGPDMFTRPATHFGAESSDAYLFWSQKTKVSDPLQRTVIKDGSKKRYQKMKSACSKNGKHGGTADPSDNASELNVASRYFANRGIFAFVAPSLGANQDILVSAIADRYILAQKVLCQRLAEVALPSKVAYVYNPLEYAFETHYKFVQKYYNSTKRVLFLGMNPGPFGMSQNGVPFGECSIVKHWMQIDGEVQKPIKEHPRRPVKGMKCRRTEISAERFWELFRKLCHTPDGFFGNCAIHSLCPMTFMTGTGKNVAPSDLPIKVLRHITFLCGVTFLEVASLFEADHVIAVGRYAFTVAQQALGASSISHVTLHCLMHPSPANPSANKGWVSIAEAQLREFGVYDIITFGPRHPGYPLTKKYSDDEQRPQHVDQEHLELSQQLHKQQQQHLNVQFPSLFQAAMFDGVPEASTAYTPSTHSHQLHSFHPHYSQQQQYQAPYLL